MNIESILNLANTEKAKEINNEQNSILITKDSELRVKFNTDIPELKSKNLQNMVLKGSYNRLQILNILKKAIKYTGSKEIEIFVNQKLFKHTDQMLYEFILNEKINTGEQVLEIFYCFQLEEPKLIDSIKQDEWIKKIYCISPGIFSVGLFNSDINFFNSSTNQKVDPTYFSKMVVKDIYEENSDYTFLSDYCSLYKRPTSGNTNSNTNSLIAIAKRDNLYSLEFKELNCSSYSIGNNKTEKVSLNDSSIVGVKDINYNSLSVNLFDDRLILAGGSKGDLHLYKIEDNYEYSITQLVSDERPNKMKKKDKSKLHLIPINELRNVEQEIHHVEWINQYNFATSSVDSIKIFNSSSFSLIMQMSLNHHLATDFNVLEKDTTIVSSHDNGSVKLWDIRSKATLIDSINKAHKGLVSKVLKYPNSEFMFVSAGYDGQIKLWDRRNTKNSYLNFPKTVEEKIFSLSFNSNSLISGGSNAELEFYKLD